MKIPLRLLVVAACLCVATLPAAAASVSVIENVAWQPLTAQVKRVIEALEYQGAPLPDTDRRALAALPAGEPASVAARQRIAESTVE